MRVASSHQKSMPSSPSVTAALYTKATMIAREMSVIIPGRFARNSLTAPVRNTHPP